jgi:gamma-glutamyltranspeptidase / glutathione hydrolase
MVFSGVPGELRGLEYLHKYYGRLPWDRLFEPAIQLARYGFQVTQDLIVAMEGATESGPDFLSEDSAWAEDFAPNGTRLVLGDRITRKRYADTLEKISKEGPGVFYSGPIAQATIAALGAKNGTMSLEDLRNYTVAIREPVHITYRDWKIHACGAPAGGAVVLSALKTIEGYKDMAQENSINISTHRLDEALRFAYGEVC